MARTKVVRESKQRTGLKDVVAREYTIHMHPHVHGKGFKHRAPAAVKAVKNFAKKHMGTEDVRIDTSLNHAIWSRGVANVPHRLRVRLHRQRNTDEDAENKLFVLASHVDVPSFKKLQTEEADI